MIRTIFVMIVFLSLIGCMNKIELIKALSQDPASVCVNVSTMYGSFAFGRAVLPGTKVNVNSGACTLESIE